jgi:aarF domain-containing kinase
MRFLPRSRLGKVLAGVLVGVPTAAGGSLAMYIAFRAKTRPPEHMFRPLVDSEGNLLVGNEIVARPTVLSVVLRALELLWIFGPMFLLYWFMRWNEASYIKWLEMLLHSVERAGPAFVKAGQWSCTRQDLFEPEFRRIFQRLYSEVAIHPFADTIKIIEEDFNAKVGTVFSSIDEVPLGSGSIGQVHLATLLGPESRKVVIKVMHPGIVQTIAKDFFLINAIARFVDKNFPQFELYDVHALALAWTNHLAAQLDFRIEAEHLELFRKNFKDVDFVQFPQPLMSTQRVLVETFAPGEPATVDFLARQEVHVRDVLATKGLNTWCKMLLRDNFIHGDMHPGNILIDTTDPHKPLITMIDVGLCQKITPEEGVVTHDLMESFVKWKADICTDSLLRMGTKQRFVNVEKFSKDMTSLFNRWRPAKDSDDEVVSNILQGIFETVRANYVAMDPPYVSLLFAVLVLESFIMNLNPEFNMVRHTAPWLISEGHLSPGLIKNVVLSRVDIVKREAGVIRGRTRDFLFGSSNEKRDTIDSLSGQAGVRVSQTTAA